MSLKYNSSPNIKIDGIDGADAEKLLSDVQQITVEESLHLPDAFTVILRNSFGPGNPNQLRPWIQHQAFKVGAKVKLGFRNATTYATEFFDSETNAELLVGEITGIEAHFTEDPDAPIVIRGYDLSHRLHRGRHNRSFVNMTDADIVKKVVGEAGIPLGEVEASGAPHDYVFQENQTNMAFLRDRAARLGFELYVQDGKLHFHKPKEQPQAITHLEWGKKLQTFRNRVSSAEQVTSVEVRAWNYIEKKVITGEANQEKLITNTGNQKGSQVAGTFGGTDPKMIVVDHPVENAEEAKNMAQAICDELGGEFVLADARAEGNPLIRPGKQLKLSGLGQKYSGDYYVTDVRHFYHDFVYTTEFSVRGGRGGNLLTSLAPQQKLKPGQTNLVGIVTNNKDPEGMGRVKVKLPTLTEDHESNWARVVALGAGPDRGIYWMPEVNDEVLVCFEHGDIHRPYVIGGVWNGTDPTPETVGDSLTPVHLRTMKTRVGHYLRFVDEVTSVDDVGIYIRTKDKYEVEINETQKFIHLRTPAGNFIKIEDTGTITIHANAEIKMDAPMITLTASGPLTASGTPIRLN